MSLELADPAPTADVKPAMRSWLRCVNGCHGEYPLDTVIYRCPTCDGLLEVGHNLDLLRRRSPAAWMKLFDERYKRTAWPYGSGVWGKKEWVAPDVDCLKPP